MKNRIHVLLCDDNQLLLARCRQALTTAVDIHIIGEANGGYAGIAMAMSLAPDLIIMDYDMPDLDGVEATRRILAQNPGINILGYSAGASWRNARAMFSAGAKGYVVKGRDTELLGAIRILAAGGRYVGNNIQFTPGNSMPGRTC